MRTTGLTHLSAVSGANFTLVCGTVLLVLTALGAGRVPRLAVAALAAVGFVVLARPEPSVLRAAAMGLVGLVGLAGSRRAAGVPALAVAVVLLCVLDPWLSRSAGFALSVLATGGLLLLAGPWTRTLARALPLWAAAAVAVPLAAQAVCSPVTVLLTPQLSLVAVPANVLVAPAVAPATVLGVVAALLAPVWPQGAAGVAWLGGWAVRWIALVARRGADLPHAAVPWPEGVGGAALLAGVTVLVAARGGAGGAPARAGRRRPVPARRRVPRLAASRRSGWCCARSASGPASPTPSSRAGSPCPRRGRAAGRSRRATWGRARPWWCAPVRTPRWWSTPAPTPTWSTAASTTSGSCGSSCWRSRTSTPTTSPACRGCCAAARSTPCWSAPCPLPRPAPARWARSWPPPGSRPARHRPGPSWWWVPPPRRSWSRCSARCRRTTPRVPPASTTRTRRPTTPAWCCTCAPRRRPCWPPATPSRRRSARCWGCCGADPTSCPSTSSAWRTTARPGRSRPCTSSSAPGSCS